jgi:3-hydroxymyristoyl/3-hydroxydecanoyl-(acyl carrier protein) dehydratase
MRIALTKAIKSIKASENRRNIEAEFSFSESDPIFAGHFPGMPVIPAVYQVGLCRKVIEQETSRLFKGISKSRFFKRCVPEMVYIVKISLTNKESAIEAVCSIHDSEKALCSKIVLLYTAR